MKTCPFSYCDLCQLYTPIFVKGHDRPQIGNWYVNKKLVVDNMSLYEKTTVRIIFDWYTSTHAYLLTHTQFYLNVEWSIIFKVRMLQVIYLYQITKFEFAFFMFMKYLDWKDEGTFHEPPWLNNNKHVQYIATWKTTWQSCFKSTCIKLQKIEIRSFRSRFCICGFIWHQLCFNRCSFFKNFDQYMQ